MTRYRFGTFDFDSESAELRREGSPVRLQAQPSQVLAILLENAGQIVTRETLQQKVWADGTQVDFERGLNYCIAQVRSALSDSADSPRFVRTIPKKGYQFIAPVELSVTEPRPQGAGSRDERMHPLPAVAAQSTPLHGVLDERATKKPNPFIRLAWLAAAVLLLVGGIGFWRMGGFISRPPVVAVCLFDNETGDAAYDRTASGFSDALTVELAFTGAQRVQVIGNADILRKPRSERNLSRIHETLGADFIIIGQVQKDATKVRILAHLLRMPKQTHASIEGLDIQGLENPLGTEAEFAKRATSRFLKVLDKDSQAALRR